MKLGGTISLVLGEMCRKKNMQLGIANVENWWLVGYEICT